MSGHEERQKDWWYSDMADLLEDRNRAERRVVTLEAERDAARDALDRVRERLDAPDGARECCGTCEGGVLRDIRAAIEADS